MINTAIKAGTILLLALALGLSACDTRPNTPSAASGAAGLASQAIPTARTLAAQLPPTSNSDIGAVGAAGSYTLASGTYTVKGSGADIWGTADAFQFVYETLTGDGSITARVLSQTNTYSWAKAGVMIRETLAPGASNAFTALTPSSGALLQARTSTGASAVSIHGPKAAAPYWVRLVRAGNTLTGSISADGLSWTVIGSYTVPMASQVYIGLAVSSHLAGTLSTAVFDSLTISSAAPPPPDTQPPTVPTGLAATSVTASTVTLSWNASTDLPNPGGAGVGGYYLYSNGNTTTPIATVTSGTSATVSGLSPATAYTFQVAAFDLAVPSNVSTASSGLSVTTQALLPPATSNTDIGSVGAAGSYTLTGGTYTVKGSGADIWGTADGFQFIYETLTGDGSITARVLSQTNTNGWAKAGVMIRETLAAGSSYAATELTPSNGSVLQARTSSGINAVTTTGPKVAAPYWVRLVRSGNTFTGSISPDGLSWTAIGSYTIPMVSQVYVGLAVSSHAAGTLSTAVFDNLTITAAVPPAPPGPCSPLSFGAVGDGKIDNTTAIQNAISACAGQGGGIVELGVVGSNAVYLTGPFTLASHVQLQIDQGVTLQATSDHSRYVGAYINWVYQPHEALISAKGATDVGIIGAGTIDGAGGQLQPNGDPSWWTLAPGQPTSARPWLIEFYQCDHVTISGVTLQNQPYWTQALRFSSDSASSAARDPGPSRVTTVRSCAVNARPRSS